MRVQLHDRRTPRWQIAAGAALLALLAALGTLQYRWLGEVSEAERARMRESLETRVNDFAADFDRQLTRIYLSFHVDADAFEREPGKVLADALAAAQPGSPRPIKGVYLVDVNPPRPATLQRLDPTSRTLTSVEWPPELERWRRRAEASPIASTRPVSTLFLSDAIDAATPALIVPVPRLRTGGDSAHLAVIPDPTGAARAIVIWLDLAEVKAQLLEPLFVKYFHASGTSEYDVSVVSRDDPSQVVFDSAAARVAGVPPDATTGLFDLRLDEVNRITGALGIRLPLDSNGAPAPRTADKLAITIVRRANPGDSARVLMTGGNRQGAWLLRARHRAGSLEAIVAQSRRRNLAIGLGVLGLLAASFVLIIASALRQQRLAQQQMEFVAAVSHELRTPLAVICSAGENLADGVVGGTEQVKRYGSLIETEGRRLGDMVERVLRFAGISAATQTQVRASVDLDQVIVDAVNGVAGDARERGVVISVHPHAALPATLGDADALRSAVQNVVGNAVKYSLGGGRVDVSADVVDQGTVRIRVADRGIGIDPADVPQVFKPFFRGRRAIDAQVRGSGIGLSVVRHVVQSHGGDVQVDSRAGEGTTITIVLPIQTSADPRQARAVRLRPGAA